MREAIRWCIAHNILKPFLETHGSEVINMLMTEWKLEDALVIEREEGREEGRERGREERGFEVAKNALAKGLPLGVCCASRVKPQKIADQAILYLSNSESSPIIGDFLRHQAQKIHKCNRLLDTISEITGLDIETIKRFSAQ
jgi:hypothetical protein